MKTRLGWLAAVTLVVACAPAAQDEEAPEGAPEQVVVAGPRPSIADSAALIQGDTVAGMPSWTDQDWQLLRWTTAWAWENGVDALPIGERVGRIGETFVGSIYIPATLEAPGPEHLVINLRALDCVTFVENALALAHFVKEAPRDVLDRPEDAMRMYQDMITRLRYRDGRLDGYPSRLHYFSEWLADNERRGVLDLVTQDLGGVVDPERITFMSGHRTAYAALADQAFYDEIGRIEGQLNQSPRYYIPEQGVAAVADRIQTGDVIAATSTLAGLDVAHTGIALWKDGALHLMHAPLVGKNVEISELPLAERLLDINAQDGIMVARPLEAPLAGR
jgi:hypothetical protein